MSTPFQNRLVGTIIVAAVAVIFLPDMLNGKKQNQEDSFAEIPPMPVSKVVTDKKKFPNKKLSRIVKEPIVDEVAQDHLLTAKQETTITLDKVNNTTKSASKEINSKSKESLKTPTTAKANNVKHQKTVKKTVNTQVSVAKKQKAKQPVTPPILQSNYAWVIQLGSFRERHNVDNLISKLKKNGYTAFSKPIKTRHGNLIKVFVGPELSKTSLEKKLAKLKKLTNVQGKVARFKPAN